MPEKIPGSGDATNAPTARAAGVDPRSRQATKAHAVNNSSGIASHNVSASRRFLRDSAFTSAACAAFLLAIAAVGLAVELLAGVGGLWVLAGVFVVVVMAAMRHEGVL